MPQDMNLVPPHVLVVDRSSESRDVLCTLLSRGGTIPIEAASLADASKKTRLEALDLIVVDADSEDAPDSIEAIDGDKVAPIVVLGTISRGLRRGVGATIAKPYHYRDLLHRIGEVLAARRST